MLIIIVLSFASTSSADQYNLPEDCAISRAEVASIFTKAFGATEEASLSRFDDIYSDQWFYDAMAKAVNMGLFEGDHRDCLNPNDPITREEVATIFYRVTDKAITQANFTLENSFSDVEMGRWSNDEISTDAKLGYVNLDKPTMISIYPRDFEAKEQIVELINQYNNQQEKSDKITYTDTVALLMSSVTTIINAISYVLIAFVAISLVVSSIMIGIITYISVLERTKEIGILRAIGASKKDISRVFNAETLSVGFAAGAIGILSTLLLNIIINIILFSLTGLATLKATLPVVGAIVLVLISMGLTLIAGLIPSRVAAKKDPVIALRTE